MIDIEVLSANNDDLDSIIKIENQLEHERYSPDIISATLNNDIYYNIVAKHNNITLGYLSATIICDECSLIKIVTDKEYRCQGVATKLINALQDYCKSKTIKMIMLEVRDDNKNAIRLYEKCGFEKQGVRLKYYGDADAILYSKEIDDL